MSFKLKKVVIFLKIKHLKHGVSLMGGSNVAVDSRGDSRVDPQTT